MNQICHGLLYQYHIILLPLPKPTTLPQSLEFISSSNDKVCAEGDLWSVYFKKTTQLTQSGLKNLGRDLNLFRIFHFVSISIWYFWSRQWIDVIMQVISITLLKVRLLRRIARCYLFHQCNTFYNWLAYITTSFVQRFAPTKCTVMGEHVMLVDCFVPIWCTLLFNWNNNLWRYQFNFSMFPN